MKKKNRRTKDRKKSIEARDRRNRKKWKYGIIFLVIYLVSIVPYLIDLFHNPNLWNAILFLLLSVGGTMAILLLIKHHDVSTH